MFKAMVLAAAMLLAVPASARAAGSTCFGTVADGRLENGVQLPSKGNNFTAYSALGVTLGRTYVHSQVDEIVLAAYAALAQSAPGKKFLYGETGWKSGGRIRPHRTHQNGLSVDFFVPVIDDKNRSTVLPTGLNNQFGYDIEFDTYAKYQNYSIDFEAMAEHLYQLHVAAKAHGSAIALVIFEKAYLPQLFATKHGEFLKANIPFMKGRPWVRHDAHYHVDFSVPCQPVGATEDVRMGTDKPEYAKLRQMGEAA